MSDGNDPYQVPPAEQTPRRAMSGMDAANSPGNHSPERLEAATSQSPRRAARADVSPPESIKSEAKPKRLRRFELPSERRARTKAEVSSLRAKLRNRQFRGAIGWSVLGTLIPGSGLIGTKLRGLGIGLTLLFFAGLVGGGLWIYHNPFTALSLVLTPKRLVVLALILAAIPILWIITIIGTHLIRRPKPATKRERAAGATIIATLSFILAFPFIIGSGYALTSARALDRVFDSQNERRSQTRPTLDFSKGKNIWADKPRLNVLLLGGDSGTGRSKKLGLRTDTIMLVSINTQTGDSTIIQIPRNMAKVPFATDTKLGRALDKRYPRGFTNGNGDDEEYMINAIWMNVPDWNPQLFTDTDYPGADALKIAVAGATGITPDYFLLVDIDGIQAVIDALGGVRLNVNRRIPIGGDSKRPPTGWIAQGPNRLLGGYEAMWFARSRKDSSDYDRMARQSCLVNAVLDQTDPPTLLSKYEALATASSRMVMTDIPQELLSALLELGTRVKEAKITRTMFIHGEDGYYTNNPDFKLVHKRVKQAVEATEPGTDSSPSDSPSQLGPTVGPTPAESSTNPASRSTSGPTSSTATPKKSDSKVEDVSDMCAYRPER